jgi:CHAT domain-containing protein
LAVLPEGTVAVYVLAAPDALRLLYFAPGTSVGRVSVIKAADLNRKVLAFREALTDPQADPRPMGKEFYDLLVKPIESLLAGSKAKRIMWSLDGELRYIPIAALYDGSAFLIEKYDLSLFTPAGGSAPLEREVKWPWRALAVGVSKAHDVTQDDGTVLHFGALSGVPAELDSVLRVLPNSSKLLDEGFTVASFKSALENHPTLVHLATHFSFVPGDESHSFLVTGDGKPFRVADAKSLSTLSLRGVSLLTLSACETALGGSDGSEVEGISAILQKKGAEAVIATLWSVADSSTAALMAEFYRLRESNRDWTKLHALQVAQIELLRGQLAVSKGPIRGSGAVNSHGAAKTSWPANLPKYAHPYYWAPFVLMGNWK